MEIAVSSIVTACAIITSAIISGKLANRVKYYENKIDKLNETKIRLAKDWLLFHEIEKIANENISDFANEKTKTRKERIRLFAEKTINHHMIYKPTDVKKFVI